MFFPNWGIDESPQSPEKERRLKCPQCGAEWELDDAELAQATFTCGDCSTVIPLNGRGTPAPDGKARFTWGSFLPRTESKWIFVLVMVAYNYALSGFVYRMMTPFVGAAPWLFKAHGWGSVLRQMAGGIIWYPLWQTLLLIAIIEVLRGIRLPVVLQIFIASIPVAATDGSRWWPHAAGSLSGFVIFAIAYLYWRPASWWKAALVAIAIHATYNAPYEFEYVLEQVHRDRVSSKLTGDALIWSRADEAYSQAISLEYADKYGDEVQPLQHAIALFPYDANYYIALGYAYRNMGNHLKEAEDAYNKALDLDDETEDWRAWFHLSFVFYDEHRLDRALNAAHQALLHCPDNEQAEVNRQIEFLSTKAGGTSG